MVWYGGVRLKCERDGGEFYRFTQIKRFLEIRHFKNSEKGSPEHKAYSKWVINFVSHLNPVYTKLNYLPELSLG